MIITLRINLFIPTALRRKHNAVKKSVQSERLYRTRYRLVSKICKRSISIFSPYGDFGGAFFYHVPSHVVVSSISGLTIVFHHFISGQTIKKRVCVITTEEKAAEIHYTPKKW